MTQTRLSALATLVVLCSGLLWGLYWIPVRRLEAAGLQGAWGTLAITLVATALLLPGALRARRALASAPPLLLLALMLGGAAFTLYSVGFVYGRVAIVTLLYFLTPVWSTLIARLLLGQRQTLSRQLAIGTGLIGLAVMMSAGGGPPLPRAPGEWMGLIAGMLWALGASGLHGNRQLAPAPSAFVFALGAALSALALAPFLSPIDDSFPVSVSVFGWLLAAGGLWWGLSIAALIWAAARLEPARVGLLLMSEVLVGAASAALLAHEPLSAPELLGGGLVLAAGLLEIAPRRRAPKGPAGTAQRDSATTGSSREALRAGR
ncbi:EamA family transporter [Pseudooceanicola sp. GBMRC 2024]|uniref:EamA family transporter n=1 Tax=Pseudooceanicola albus TaxID=2692189 RepID=A0A6L7G1N4_9RHOB|nr:DMT family transporter [Pseudooceanicola albus]MXN17911.1 EamA family transporter [Pseudooceanicola albus]